MKILTVPGIHSDGSRSTDRMGDELRALGHEVMDVEQPRRNVLSARWYRNRDAQGIVELAEDGDAVVAHSYGGLKAAIASRTVRFSALFLFRPAMGRGYQFPDHMRGKVFCIYSKHDYTILAGALLRFRHPFGAAGFFGFRGPHTINVGSHGFHSHDFNRKHIKQWADYIYIQLELLKAP